RWLLREAVQGHGIVGENEGATGRVARGPMVVVHAESSTDPLTRSGRFFRPFARGLDSLSPLVHPAPTVRAGPAPPEELVQILWPTKPGHLLPALRTADRFQVDSPLMAFADHSPAPPGRTRAQVGASVGPRPCGGLRPGADRRISARLLIMPRTAR